MRVRWSGLAAVLAVVIAFGGVPAGAEPTRVDLAGTTVVSGSTSGVMPVHIPVPVETSAIDEFSTQPPSEPISSVEQLVNPDLEISGAGRLFGIVLTQNGPQRQRPGDNDGATLFIGRYGMCSGTGCTPLLSGVDVVTAFGPGVEKAGDSATARYVLPAGDYNLYLLTDGAPASVTIRLHGLSGETALTPAAPIDMHLSEATPQDSRGLHYSAADQHTFSGLGMIAMARLSRGPMATGFAGGYCIVKQTTAPAPTDAADGASGCLSRQPATEVRRASGDQSDNWHGKGGAQALTMGGGVPAGTVVVQSSFDPGVYRITQDYVTTTPLDDGRALLALWLAWA